MNLEGSEQFRVQGLKLFPLGHSEYDHGVVASGCFYLIQEGGYPILICPGRQDQHGFFSGFEAVGQSSFVHLGGVVRHDNFGEGRLIIFLLILLKKRQSVPFFFFHHDGHRASRNLPINILGYLFAVGSGRVS